MHFSKLSNQELESQLLHFVRQERKLLHVILMHIREVDKRKVYLEKARSSLFEYLTKDLGYSAAAAQRRVEASRLLKTIPELAEKIQTGSLNLSQIGELHRAIQQKEKESVGTISVDLKTQLLCKIENKSTFETQKILAQELDIQLKPLELKKVQKDESVHLQLTMSKVQYAKLQECKDLAGHVLLQRGDAGTCAVLDVIMDAFLNMKKSNRTGVKTEDEKKTTSLFSSPATASTKNSISASEVKPMIHTDTSAIASSTKSDIQKIRTHKTLTPKTRKMIFKKYTCCQYKDPQTQKICGSRFALEVDHQQPRWAGGGHDFSNLILLCANHNKYKYQRQAQVRFR